jgi:hypothetical protein
MGEMSFLSPIEGEILASLVTIGIGTVMEKWYVSWWSVGINIVTFIVALMTPDLDAYSLVILIAYIALGIASAVRRWERAYFLFGSKTYGSLMLALGSLTIPSWSNQLVTLAASFQLVLNDRVSLLAFTWGLYFTVVHVIGEIYNRVGPSFGAKPEGKHF